MIKRLTISVFTLFLFVACGDKKEEKVSSLEMQSAASKETNSSSVQEKKKEVASKIPDMKEEETKIIIEKKKVEVNNIVENKVQEVKKLVEEKKILAKKELSSMPEIDAAKLYAACSSCHGLKADKAALGKSEVISEWSEAKINEALLGYKNGSYGKMMKGLMQGQVKNLSEEEIKALSAFITKLK